MSHAPMCSIELLRVYAVELAHSARKRGRARLDQQVIMIGHETIAAAHPIVSFTDLRHYSYECRSVTVVEKDRLSAISA
jgi:hypothetical protein